MMLAREIGQWQSFAPMKLGAIFAIAFAFALWTASAQTPEPEPTKSADAAQLEALAKKIDEILKLEQQVSHIRPGIMIGESTPSSANAAAPVASPSYPPGANTHIVARGETLTAIAKTYKVSVDELQKANHIEDGRKLQAGQTITIPMSGTPTPTPAE